MTDEQVNQLYQLARSFCIKKHIWYDDDLIQELVMNLYDKYNKYDESKGSFSTFAFMCCKNYLYSYKFKTGPEILVENNDEVFVDKYIDSDEKLIVADVLGSISDDTILMDWLNGLSYEEIARRHNKHRTTVSRYINKRIEELKNEYVGG